MSDPEQAVVFAFKPGFQVRHVTSDQVVTIIRQKVKTVAPGKMEPMYVVKLEDGSELNVRQLELVLIPGGAKKKS